MTITIISQNLQIHQKDRQDNTNYYKSNGDLPIDVRRAILPIYQSLWKYEMLEKCLHSKTQNTNKSFKGIIWNRVPKATYVGLDVLSLGAYDATANFNHGKKAALDIMELLKIDPGYYMTNCYRSANMRGKHSSIYRMSKPLKKRRKVLRHFKKSNKTKKLKLKEPHVRGEL